LLKSKVLSIPSVFKIFPIVLCQWISYPVILYASSARYSSTFLYLGNMKFAIAALLAGLVIALPQKKEGLGIGGIPPGSNMASSIASLMDRNGKLDAGVMPKIRNEIIDPGPCGKAVFIFARASQEPANMVWKKFT
jgi:hypothetical protein